MIYKLRKRMTVICGISLLAVFIGIFLVIYSVSNHRLNTSMDMLTDRISGGGIFMPLDDRNPPPKDMNRFPGFLTEETPFSTRFFIVRADKNRNIIDENVDMVFSVSRDAAHEYASRILRKSASRGWIDNYRYKISEDSGGIIMVFVDGSMNKAVTMSLLATSASVLTGSVLIIMLLIVLLSKRAVRPMAESYEKQKQFVTDANHELKTPLTLILTNLDIVEAELGHSEWLDDIRSEGKRMSGLVEQLTALSRLDEDGSTIDITGFSLSDVCNDTVSEFTQLAEAKGYSLRSHIQCGIHYSGDEAAIRRLLSILLDNAVKYCDAAGEISLSLSLKRHPVIIIENTYAAIDSLELERLFDRFYRADKARTAGSSFGIGLSLAKSIAEKHRGDIKAYKAGPERIGFRITIK